MPIRKTGMENALTRAGGTVKLWKHILLIAIICLCACGCSKTVEMPGIKREVNEYLEKSIEVSGSYSLNLICDSADMEVYSWDRQEIKFEITKRVRGTGEKEELEKRLKNFDIVLEQEAGSVTFKSEYKGRMEKPYDTGIGLKVYLPKKIQVLRCTLDTSINMANLTINRFDGILRLNADMCDLRIAEGRIRPGSVVNINMGNIHIKGEFEDSDNYSIQTGMGNVEINVPAGSSARFNTLAGTDKGESGSIPGIKVHSGMGRVTISEY